MSKLEQVYDSLEFFESRIRGIMSPSEDDCLIVLLILTELKFT